MTGAAPSPDVFSEKPFLLNPTLSPNGLRIAAEGSVGGKSRLVLWGVDDHKYQVVGLDDLGAGSIRWAGDDRVLLTIMVKQKIFGIEFPVPRLLLIDASTGKATGLDVKSQGIFAANIIYVAPDGGSILVSSQNDISQTPSVKRIDLATNQTTVVERARPDVWSWYADDKGVVRAGIAYRGSRWIIWYRAQAGDPLKPIRGRTKEDEGAVDGLKFLANDRQGVIITNTKTGRFAVYNYDFTAGAIGAPIYENSDVDVTSVIMDGRDQHLAGVNYEDDRRRIEWIDPSMRSLQAIIDRVLPKSENIVVNSSTDQNRHLIWTGSGSDPGAYYVFDRKKKTMALLSEPYEKLSALQLSSVEPIHYSARDGLVIHGYLTIPIGRPAKDLPLIVMPHGGPFVRDSWEFDRFAQFLASRGYAVLQPNFRGSTGYGKEFVARGYGQWGRGMQDDLDDGVDWLAKQGRIDPKRVCLMGASYGGYAALWGAIRNPERYRCAISLAGVTDLPGMMAYDRRQFSASRYFKAWQDKVKGENQQDLSLVSPLAQADRLTRPVLVAHGEDDGNVPAKQGHQFVQALQKRHADVESVFYPKEGHGLSKPEDMADFLKRVETFLAKYDPA